MKIEAAGRTWVVDAHEVTEGSAAAHGCWEVSFTRPEREFDRVDIRWIPRPERMTERVARQLFELAGERLWRDPRTEVIYRVQLLDEGGPAGDADPSGGRMLIRFRTSNGSGTVPYELACPLGCASDGQLESLVDLASPDLRGASA